MENTNKLQYAKVGKIVPFYRCKKITIVPDETTKEFVVFQPGQYVILNIEIDGKLIPRFHTIASSPKNAKQEYSFFIKDYKDGFTSKYINKHWKVGTKLSMSLPMGELYVKPNDCKTIIACCHGNSLVPFLSIASAIADGILDINLTILHGVDYEKDLIFKPDLLDIIDKTKGKFKLVNLVSKEHTKVWKEGLITAKEILLAANNQEFTLLASGSAKFYDYMDKIAKELNIPSYRYRKDRDTKEFSVD